MASNFTDVSTTEERATEFKAIPGQFNIDEALGIVECFVAGIGNKDSVGDVCLPGAFGASLKRRKPRVVWGHNWNEPIGKVLDIYEVGPNDQRLPMKMRKAGIGGLYAKVQFNLKSERGKEAFNSVAFFGEEQEWSIGYKTLDAVFDPTQQANLLKEVELYEVSPVLHGANQLTGTISIKSDQPIKDPKGGLTAAGRKYFKQKEGANLKPGVKGPANTPEKMRRKGSFLTRFFTNPSGPMTKPDGSPTRLALSAAAWGEPVPKNRSDAAKLAAKGRRLLERYENTKEKAANQGDKCPVATKEVAVNIRNRQKAIETAGYGPLNPKEKNDTFWSKKADRWDVDLVEAKKQLCGNCAAFIKTDKMLNCIESGLSAGDKAMGSSWDVIEAGDLGYCEAFDFKCAASRTCDAWIVGGPITEAKSYDDDDLEYSDVVADEFKGHGGSYYPSTDVLSNSTVGMVGDLTKALAERFSAPVQVRHVEKNMVVFDVMNGGQTITMRMGYHWEGDEFMFGDPQQVRAETVYIPTDSPAGHTPSHVFSSPRSSDKPFDQAQIGIERKPDSDCGCGCNGAGSCGTSSPFITWEKMKEKFPGMHMFIRSTGAQKSEIFDVLNTVCDYYGIELKNLEDGLCVPFIDEVDDDAHEAIMNLAQNLSSNFQKKNLRTGLNKRKIERFDPNAWDGDDDGLVQDATQYERPAKPRTSGAMSGGSESSNARRYAYASRAKFDTRKSLLAKEMYWSPENSGTVTAVLNDGRTVKFEKVSWDAATQAGDPSKDIDDFIKFLSKRDGIKISANKVNIEKYSNYERPTKPGTSGSMATGDKPPRKPKIANNYQDYLNSAAGMATRLGLHIADDKKPDDKPGDEPGDEPDKPETPSQSGKMSFDEVKKFAQNESRAQKPFDKSIVDKYSSRVDAMPYGENKTNAQTYLGRLSAAINLFDDKNELNLANALNNYLDRIVGRRNEKAKEAYEKYVNDKNAAIGRINRFIEILDSLTGNGRAPSASGKMSSPSDGPKARGEDELRAVREMAIAYPWLSEKDLNEIAVIARIGNPEDITPLAKRLNRPEKEVAKILDEFGDRRDRVGKFATENKTPSSDIDNAQKIRAFSNDSMGLWGLLFDNGLFNYMTPQQYYRYSETMDKVFDIESRQIFEGESPDLYDEKDELLDSLVDDVLDAENNRTKTENDALQKLTVNNPEMYNKAKKQLEAIQNMRTELRTSWMKVNASISNANDESEMADLADAYFEFKDEMLKRLNQANNDLIKTLRIQPPFRNVNNNNGGQSPSASGNMAVTNRGKKLSRDEMLKLIANLYNRGLSSREMIDALSANNKIYVDSLSDIYSLVSAARKNGLIKKYRRPGKKNPKPSSKVQLSKISKFVQYRDNLIVELGKKYPNATYPALTIMLLKKIRIPDGVPEYHKRFSPYLVQQVLQKNNLKRANPKQSFKDNLELNRFLRIYWAEQKKLRNKK